MSIRVVDLAEALSRIHDHWQPHVAGRLNGQEVRLAKFAGDFVWHAHEEADELFLVVKGRMEMQLRDRTLEVGEGQLVIVPRGVEHCPRADEEVHLLLFEPAETLNTGDAPASERTVTVLSEV